MNEKRNRAGTPNNKTTTGFRISDELWEVLQPLLPEHRNTHPLGGARPRRPDRECADAIFYVLHTGCQWKALDQAHQCRHYSARLNSVFRRSVPTHAGRRRPTEGLRPKRVTLQDLRSSRDWHFGITPTGTAWDANPLCRLPATVSEVPVTFKLL